MRRRAPALLAILSATALGFVVGQGTHTRAAQSQDRAVWDRLGLMARVLSEIELRYVEPVDQEQIIYAGLRGMVGQLDPHSRFLDARELSNMRNDTRGEYVGVGMEVRTHDEGGVVVGNVFPGGPAGDAGVQTGDRLLAVDGEDATEWTTDQVVARLRGERGAAVQLTVARIVEEVPQTLQLDLVRDVIRMEAVSEEMPVPGYGVVRVRMFQSGVGEQVRAAIDRLQADENVPLVGLVLDLRDDPGGLLSEAISLSDAFLSEGQIVSTAGRDATRGEAWSASRSNTRWQGPLVVLVNGQSASASEIVAGALQDNGRAVIVGTRTYGKGSVQSIIDLPGGTGLKLTTSLYYTPSGRSIQNLGITPDFEVEAGLWSPDDQTAPREGQLQGALPNPNGDATSGFDLSAVTDRQLRVALQQLHAFSVFANATR